MNDEVTYSLGHQTKIEYGEDIESPEYTKLNGPKEIPEIGGTPDEVDADDLDCVDFHKVQDGLMPAVKLDIPFNMEDPDINANINLVHQMKISKKVYKFRITYTNEITVVIRSKVKYSFNAVNPNELLGFTMHLSAIGEPDITVPSGSVSL